MGRGIVYCASCGTKILDRDFDSRAAFHLDSKGFCKACAPGALKSLPPDKMAQVLAQISQSESSPARKAPPPPRPPAPATRRHEPDASRTPLIAGLALAGVVIVILVVVMLSRSDPPPAPPPPPPTVGERPPKVDREALAAQALQKAREYRDQHPKEFATQVASYQRLIEDHQGTRAAGDAQRDLEEIRRRDLESKLKTLKELAGSSSSAEEFQKAIQKLTEQRGQNSDPIWTLGIDQEIAQIKGLAEKLYPDIKAAALEARRKGSAAGVQEAKERLLKWGIPLYIAELEAALAAIPVSSKRPLINGKDLGGWYVTRGKWVFKDGMLQTVEVDENQRTFIATNDEFEDFELEGMIETTIKTYVEINARGVDRQAAMHLETGWHKFRVVAAGTDVKLFVDENPVPLPKGSSRRGQFGFFSLGAIRLKDIMIRP